MKNKIFKSGFCEKLKLLLVLLGVLITSLTTQVWGMKLQKNACIYFDNTNSQWSYAHIYLAGQDIYCWEMGHIANTNLYLHNRTDNNWDNCSCVRVFGDDDEWPTDTYNFSHIQYWCSNVTNIDESYSDFISFRLAVLTADKTGTKEECCRAGLTYTYLGEGDTDEEASESLNRTITISAKVSTDNGGSYSETTSPAALSASSYKFSNYYYCGTSTSLDENSEIVCGYTATTTLTAPSTDPTGYVFIGWYDASGNEKTTSKTLTIYPTSNTTYYAYYRKLFKVSANSTVVWDLGEKKSGETSINWSKAYIRRDVYNSSAVHDELTHLGSGSQWSKTYTTATSYMNAFMFRARNDGTWNGLEQTTNITNDISNVTIFTYCNSTTNEDSKDKLDWQVTTDGKKGATGRTIYFDDTYTEWNSSSAGHIFFNYGVDYAGGGGFHRYIDFAATKVPGTENLWKLKASVSDATNRGATNSSGQLSHDIYFQKWYVSKNYGYTNHYPITDTNVEERTAIYTDAIVENDFTLIPTSGSGSSPKTWTTTKMTGHEHSVKIGSHTNGIITLHYTDENGVSQNPTSNVSVAHTCNVNATAAADNGYDFVSMTKGGAAYTPGTKHTVRGEVTFAATFTAHTYNITLNAGDHGSAAGSATIVFNTSELASKTDATANAGYTLEGYYDSDGTTKVLDANGSFAATNVTGYITDGKWSKYDEDATLTAHWTENTHKVNLANDGHGHVEIGGETVTSVSGVGIATASGSISAVNNTGYHFDSWTGDINNGVTIVYPETMASSTITINATADGKTITANFAANTYTVTLDQEGGEDGLASVSATYDAQMPTIDAEDLPSKSNYSFAGYYDGDGGAGTIYYNANGTSARAWDIDAVSPTLYAKWTENTFTVSFADDGYGSTTPSSDQSVGVVSGVSIGATPDPGYDFDEWVSSNGGTFTSSVNTASNTFKPTANTTLTAKFKPATYNGTLEGLDGSDGTYSVVYGETTLTVTGVAPSLSGYHPLAYFLTYDEAISYYGDPIAYASESTTKELRKSANKGSTYYTDEDGKWIYTGAAPTIYVKWEADTYEISLDKNLPEGTTGTDGTLKIDATYNALLTTAGLVKPEAVGYTFAGYYDDPDDEEGTMVITANGTKNLESGTPYINSDGLWTYADDVTLYAHWTKETYSIILNDRYATTSVSPSSVDVTFDSKTLASITAPRKWGSTFGGWVASSLGTGTVIIDADGNLVEGVGGYTDESGNWKRDVGANGASLNLYAMWTPIEHLYWISGDDEDEFDNGTEFTSAGDGKYYVKVDMNPGDKFHLGDGVSAGGPSSNTNFTLATSSCGIGARSTYFNYNGESKQTVVFVLDLNAVTLDFENFVIYKPGDQEYDTHTAYGSVEGFSGTIYGTFEYRMPVTAIGKWSTLYLPFAPTNVQVWDGAYYDIFPCHRTAVDGPLYEGYYVIRKPEKTTDWPIKDFKNWLDPTYYDGWKPTANTPYIIYWQMGYFMGKYISFWGDDVTIASSFSPAGSAPTQDSVVNVLGNGTMATGYVKAAYVLADDYGNGAWLRDENVENTSPVGPFECYILANSATTTLFPVIGRELITGQEQTPTGWEELNSSLSKPHKVIIDGQLYIIRDDKMYTIQGALVK